MAAVLVCVTLLGTALLLFTGSMEASCGDTALTIHATWWADLSLSYSEIDTIEYRSNLDTGMRTNGFGSARFSLGTFCNDEFGSYTLYAYTKASEFVVLTADGKTLVIGMDEPERTREIYDELIDCFKEEPKLLHYIDMPMQHSEDAILKRMGRRTDRASIETVIGKLREAAPDIAIRTSLIAGFPGETQEDHEALMAFLDEQELDRVGVFAYSREDGTPAATFENQIDEETAEQWRNEIMELQQEISLDKNETFVGKIMQVIIEGYSSDDDVYVGRTYRDAPGVDGLVFVNCDYELMSGQIVDVRINEVGPYDMIGGIVDESAE